MSRRRRVTPRRPAQPLDTVAHATEELVAGINGLTFDETETNADYVRKIRPLIHTALREIYEKGAKCGARNVVMATARARAQQP